MSKNIGIGDAGMALLSKETPTQSVTALKQHVPHVRSDLRSDNVLASHVGHVGTYPCTHLTLTAPENSSPLEAARSSPDSDRNTWLLFSGSTTNTQQIPILASLAQSHGTKSCV